ncbi:hypothetical protein D3C77_521830 [compost metagenome]
MDNDKVIELLKNYRSYKFCAMNLGTDGRSSNSSLPLYSQRKPRFISNHDRTYDGERYGRIIAMLESAVEFVLNDDQRTIVNKKYMERNTLNLSEIAEVLNKDRKTIGTQHKMAINSLSKALLPISEDYMEITNLDHMFISDWEYKEPA